MAESKSDGWKDRPLRQAQRAIEEEARGAEELDEAKADWGVEEESCSG